MKTMIPILAVLAVLQIGLAVWAFSGKTQLSGQTTSSTLLNFEKAQIDQVNIVGDDKTVELQKKDGKWQTADTFPLEPGKMDVLLDKLASLKFSLPVATSETALKRFKVADDDFERHVTLKKSGDVVAELYLGTGSGVRNSHLRNAQQEAVYTGEIGSYDLPVAEDEWQDKTLLQLSKESISGITLGDLSLSLADDKADPPASAAEEATGASSKPKLWKATSLPEGKKLDQAAINEALSSFGSLRFSKVLGKEAESEYGMDKPELSVSLKHTDGERTYSLAKLKDAEEYVLKVSDRDEYFRLSSGVGKGLVEKVAQDAWAVDFPQAKAETKAVTPSAKSDAKTEPSPASSDTVEGSAADVKTTAPHLTSDERKAQSK